MTCSNCGSYVKDGSKFCMTCGNPVTPKPAVSPASVQSTPIQSSAPMHQPQYQQPISNQATQLVSEGEGSKGPAIASMVCGIVGLVFAVLCSCSGVGAAIALVLGIVAVALAIVARNSNLPGRKMATAGLTCGIIAIVIAGLFCILILIGKATGNAIVSSSFDVDDFMDLLDL